MTTKTQDNDWVPTACTLPTAERPLRLAEFDSLFATAVRRIEHTVPTRARLTLGGTSDLLATIEDLTARETACCSFFTFTITPADAQGAEGLFLDVEVPPAHVEVLAALVARASAVAAA